MMRQRTNVIIIFVLLLAMNLYGKQKGEPSPYNSIDKNAIVKKIDYDLLKVYVIDESVSDPNKFYSLIVTDDKHILFKKDFSEISLGGAYPESLFTVDFDDHEKMIGLIYCLGSGMGKFTKTQSCLYLFKKETSTFVQVLETVTYESKFDGESLVDNEKHFRFEFSDLDKDAINEIKRIPCDEINKKFKNNNYNLVLLDSVFINEKELRNKKKKQPEIFKWDSKRHVFLIK